MLCNENLPSISSVILTIDEAYPSELDKQFKTTLAARNFHYSRRALAQAAENQGVETCEHPEIHGHLHLKEKPNIVVSLSHTKGVAAAIAANVESYLSVGVDIEWCDRQMHPDGGRHFENSEDSHQLTTLEVWSAKEAAFKALAPVLENFSKTHHQLLLIKIWITNNSFGLIGQKAILGTFDRKKITILERELLVTTAWINQKEIQP